MSDEGGEHPPFIGAPTTCTAYGPDAVRLACVASGDGAVDDEHRLATVSPDPLSMPAGSHRALLWSSGEAVCHPLMADEWARTEAGMPCSCSGSVATVPPLEERAPDDLEYE